MNNYIEIKLGAFCEPISKQLSDAGFVSIGNSPQILDKLADAITTLYLKGILTEGETKKARQRLVKQIQIMPENGGGKS